LGHIVYRVEKPGMGDGPSPCNCETTGFEKEMDVFEAGYKKLLTYNWAEQDRIFIVGHSMGGVQAPLLTTRGDYRPKGIAVYGTVFQTWYEYILMMLRFQEPRTDEAYLTFEADMQEYIKLFYEHYVQFKPLAEITKNPKWKALLERDFLLDDQGNILFRRWDYWQEIARHTLADAWAKTDAHVLSMYGEADFEVFDSFSMSEIARIVNHSHPGHGKYVLVSGTDHGMIEVGSMDKGLELRGKPEYRDYYLNHFNWQIITEIDTWIRAVMAGDRG
jgi:pimeloyl-ACP methyl ester carboxylesterase